MLQVIAPQKWSSWSTEDKQVYIYGFVDTIASYQLRMKENGKSNDLNDLEKVISTVGIKGILASVEKTGINESSPLPWSMARGLGLARKILQEITKKP